MNYTIEITSYDEHTDSFAISTQIDGEKVSEKVSGLLLPLIINEFGDPDELVGKSFTRVM